MKKHIQRVFALLLVCMVFSSVLLPVSAAEIGSASSNTQPYAEYEDNANDIVVTTTRATGLPFTVTAKNVTSFVTTSSSGKSFVSYQFASTKRIWVDGYLYHSVASASESIKAGACYWNSDAGRYDPGPAMATKSGGHIYTSMLVSDLVQGKTYYGYIKNLLPNGSVNDGSFEIR